MSETTKQIRAILANWIDDIDAGNTKVSEEESEMLLDTLSRIASPYVSAYTAQRMAKVKHRSTFQNMINDGRLPDGEHVQGFKEKHFNKYLVSKAVDQLKTKH